MTGVWRVDGEGGGRERQPGLVDQRAGAAGPGPRAGRQADPRCQQPRHRPRPLHRHRTGDITSRPQQYVVQNGPARWNEMKSRFKVCDCR